jgi:hypothetical protein
MQNENFINDKFTIDELLRRSWKHRNSSEFFQFFNFVARFEHYSRFNTMLVYIQNPAITFFGGTSFWKKKFNRSIKEGARPHIILVPKGPVMIVYDIFDTIGKQSTEQFLATGLGSKPGDVFGKLDESLFSSTIQKVQTWGIKLSYKPLNYFSGGYITSAIKSSPEICIKEGMPIEENISVLIHELAHLFLGHTGNLEISQGKGKSYKIEARKLRRSAEELEAEVISFLICKKLGLETRAAEYIAGYIKNEDDLLQFSYENVIKTADKIEKLFL